MVDPYEVLGVRRGASQGEIKDAWRRLCMKYHPDRHADNDLRDLAEEKLRAVNAAYETLGDPEKRQAWDRGAGAGGGSERPAPAALQTIWELVANRQFSRALTELDGYEARHGKSGTSHRMRGAILCQQEKWREALGPLEAAMSADPGDGEVAEMYAWALVHVEEWREAATTFARARSILGDKPDLMAGEAIARENLGEKAAADALFRRVEAEDPANELLAARRRAWKVGNQYVGKDETRSNACCICLLLQLLFDCF